MEEIIEEEEFKIPAELQRKIIDIMNDCPDIKELGEGKYRVYNLRMYSYNRILKLGLELCKDNPEEITNDKQVLFSLCTDIDKACEIVAIVLCNHLFKPENVDINNIDSVYSYNDNLIRYMKARIENSTINDHQWAGIILGAITSIDLSEVFTMLVLVRQHSVSMTKTRTKAEEQFQSWQEAKQVM